MIPATTIFMLPFAGGNRYSYNLFIPCLRGHYNIHPIELPGHGARGAEELLEDMERAVERVVFEISKNTHQP